MPQDTFTRAYIECALWSSTDDEGEPLDGSDADLAPSTVAEMESDCKDFQESFSELLQLAYDSETVAYDESRAGHDFWLTRCGHGAGFWDRGLGQVGKELTDMAKPYGNRDLYIGDDGLIYQA